MHDFIYIFTFYVKYISMHNIKTIKKMKINIL